ncbi:MAG TPA: adenine deaminase [Anaerolineae bacterium]|nr:adenine deaminase [Anaerolineae bacterium]
MRAVDLLLHNAQIADLFRLRVIHGWVGVQDGRFLYVEPGEPPAEVVATKTRDLGGRFLVPGLVDAHMHIESSLVTPRRFAQAALSHGTTAVLADPHEIANVAGEAGVRWMIRASEGLPLRIYYAVPSCVPATSPELEWTGAVFDADVVQRLADEPSVIALGEVMDYRSVLAGDERLHRMVETAHKARLLAEGHIPSLSGTELSEYLAWGIGSDHTLTNPEKILEQTSKGLAVMLQAKSLLPENIAAVASLPDRSRILLVTDDIEPSLLVKGHLSRIVQEAIRMGMPPLEALAAASLRPAWYLGLRELGAIAPGRHADFLVMDAPGSFPPREVFVGGRLVAADGIAQSWESPALPPLPPAYPVPGPLRPDDFRLAPELAGSASVIANAVVVQNELNTLTDLERVVVQVAGGHVVLTERDDLALAAVFARNSSSHTVGLIKNLGLRTGAFASSFAHDSHNLLVIGRDPRSMATAATAVYEMAGGVAIAHGSAVLARLALPIAGVITDAPLTDVARELTIIEQRLRELGMRHQRPFLLLSIMSLSVSPRYKFTDKGVVDVERRTLSAPYEDRPNEP